jgi:polar amino acid transport system substrate-binding protein
MSGMTRRTFALLGGAASLGALGVPGLALAEGTLDKIRKSGTVTVGTEAAFPPFEFIENGKVVGYGSDILAEIVKAMGVKLNQLDLPWQGILPGVLAGKFDFVATTVGINEERAKRYAYTMPIANGQPYAVKRKGDAIKSATDLNGKVVATQLASSTEPVARDYDANLKAAGGKGFADLKLFTAFTESYVALANGEVDAVIQSLPSLAYLVKQQPDTFELLGTVEVGHQYTYLAWVTRPDDLELRAFLNGEIRKMRDDGRLYALQDKWFGFRMDIPDSGYLPPGAV